MVDLKVRVATLEAANAPDMSGYATQASLDAIEAQVSQLLTTFSKMAGAVEETPALKSFK